MPPSAQTGPRWGAKLKPLFYTGGAYFFGHMPFYVYILQNDTTKRFYVGQTSNPEKRLEAHNSRTRDLKRYTTKQPGLWTIVYSEQYETRSAAMQREKQIKSWKNKKALLELISSQ